MRICMLNITAGGMSGGYRNYLSNLVPRLAVHPEVETLLVGVPQSVGFPQITTASGSVQWLPLRRSASLVRGGLTGSEREAIAASKPDVLFIPTSRFSSSGSIPVVNMVRNMMPMTPHNSRYCLEQLRNWARFLQMKHAVSQADRVIAISQFVKDYLTHNLGLAEDRVGVVYHGTTLDSDLPMHKPAVAGEDWIDRFFFTAGLIYPYRGIEDLIEAWQRLRGLPDLPPLVIAGKVGQGMSGYYAKLLRLVQEKGLRAHVHFAGLLSRSEMAWCYNHCSAFIMTSRVEACPNIALEAMASGSLCISTMNPPLPEIFAEAAWYYPAGQSGVLAERIREAMQLSDGCRMAVRTCAIARAARFTWDVCCRRTVEELQKAIQ